MSININLPTNVPTPSPLTTQLVHVKVNFEGEFRRFTLETLSYNYLETSLRQLYSLGATSPLRVKFEDEEKDWILISSDEELKYAVELSTSPLRLVIQDLSKLSETEEKPATTQDVPRARVCPKRGGKHALSVVQQERLTAKSGRLSERIKGIEERLNGNEPLTSENQRVLRWRLGQLQKKLARVQEKKASLEQALSTTSDNNSDNIDDHPKCRGGRCGRGSGRRGHGPHGHGAPEHGPDGLGPHHEHGPHGHGHGHGPHHGPHHEHGPHHFGPHPEHGPHGHGPQGPARGCRRGRGRCGGKWGATKSNEPQFTDSESARNCLVHFRQCKVDLKIARKSGDPNAIESCKQALKQAKNSKKESLAYLLDSQRAHKRECFMKLKEAQRNGSEEEIAACKEALAQAMTELKKAKAEILAK